LSACLTCSGNSFCLGGANQPVAWTACTPGTYQTTAPTASVNRVCGSCVTSGEYCDGSGSKLSCPAGSFCTNTATKQGCTAGYYCPAGSVTQTACMKGTYSNVLGATLVGMCLICPAGNYSGVDGSISCAGCVSPNYCAAGSTAQNLCPVGSFCTNTSTKTTCSSGNYCPAGSTAPTLCPVGSFCTNTSTKTTCTSGNYCPAGVTVQTICALGSYCTNTSTQQACVSTNYCAAGSISQTPCPAGFYCSNPSTKITCPQNSYCPAGSITQTLCWAGSRGAAIGSSSASNCIPCLAGTYSSTQGSIICTNCTKGSNYSSSSATACTTCSPNPVCTSPEFIQSCTTTSNSMCAACNDLNLPQHAQWMDNIVDDCVWACDRTSQGYFKVSNTCQACKIPSSCVTGNYVTTCNATADGVCNPCNNKPLNSFYTSASVSYDQSGCEWSCNGGFSKGASTCDSCGMGTYSLQGDNLCSSCTNGKYTPTIGATSCTPCPLCTVTGDFRSGCSGTSPGTCDKCINPT